MEPELKKKKFEFLQKHKKNIIYAFLFLILLVGVSYAYFNHYERDERRKVIAGDIYLNMDETGGFLTLTNAFPESAEKARSKTNNVVTFTVDGRNSTTDQTIYYEILLSEGNTNSNYTVKIKPEHLRFDLVEIVNGVQTMVVSDASFETLNNTRIWVNKVNPGTTEVSRTYQLRVWIDENVILSDTLINADYSAVNWKNSYASIKVSVFGDFEEKKMPYNYMTTFPTTITNQKTNITEANFVSMETTEMESRYNAASIKADLTDTSKTDPGLVYGWLEPDTTDTSKYILYVASDGTTFFPAYSYRMFYNWTNLKNINFENVDTTKVTNMSGMFYYCSGLTSLDLSGFVTTSVTNMFRMFYYCTSLTSLDVSGFVTTSVTDMSDMFSNCSGLTSLDVSGFVTTNVKYMSSMFSGCSALTSLDVSGFVTTSVTDMSSMFNYCSGLISLDVSGFDITGVTNMSQMFFYCSSLTTIYANTDWNTTTVTSSGYMFSGCSKLKGAISYDSSKIDVTAANPTTGYFTTKTA